MGIEESKKGSPAYDSCAKYDYIYHCLIHNMNYVTNEADADATIDKMTSFGLERKLIRVSSHRTSRL